MLASIAPLDDRALTWSSAASLLTHLGVAMVIATPWRSRLPEPPRPPEVAAFEVEVPQDDTNDKSAGRGANRVTPVEVATRAHVLHGGPERAARSQSQREVAATQGRRVGSISREERASPHRARSEGRTERGTPSVEDFVQQSVPEGRAQDIAAASASVQASGGQGAASPQSTGPSAGREDPLDRVLAMHAEREELADAHAALAEMRSVRTGPGTTVLVSGPALADGVGATEGFGEGSGGRGRRAGPDKSSPARLGGPVWWWFCPWPREADSLPVRHATTKLAVAVTPEGRATSARVIEDGSEFGAAARQCAMKHVYVSARDRDGRAVAGTTLPFVVRFDR